MSRDPDHHHRHSIRLRGYDYSQPGAYFITVWDDLPRHFPSIIVDALVIMPNHVRGIIILTECPTTSTPPGAETAPLRPPTVGEIVAHFKPHHIDPTGRGDRAPTAADRGGDRGVLQVRVCGLDQPRTRRAGRGRVAAQLQRPHHPRDGVTCRVPEVHCVEPGSLGGRQGEREETVTHRSSHRRGVVSAPRGGGCAGNQRTTGRGRGAVSGPRGGGCAGNQRTTGRGRGAVSAPLVGSQRTVCRRDAISAPLVGLLHAPSSPRRSFPSRMSATRA